MGTRNITEDEALAVTLDTTYLNLAKPALSDNCHADANGLCLIRRYLMINLDSAVSQVLRRFRV